MRGSSYTASMWIQRLGTSWTASTVRRYLSGHLTNQLTDAEEGIERAEELLAMGPDDTEHVDIWVGSPHSLCLFSLCLFE